MNTITKTSGKYVAEIKSTTAETKAPNGSFEAVLSVPTVDRDKEVLDAGAFNPLPDHITIDIDHAMTVEKTVGSGRPYYDGTTLKFEGTYASHPLAQMVRSLVEEGHIRTMSVAYMNSTYEVDKKDGLPHLRSGELLNAGIVGIPSNREALITASKSLVHEVNEAVTDAVDEPPDDTEPDPMVAIQAAHDALHVIGAVCSSESPADQAGEATPTETTPEKAAAAARGAAAAVTPAAVDVVPLANEAYELAGKAALL